MDEIICNECGWIGDTTMLVSASDNLNDRDFIYCPDCWSDDIKDIDENEEEE